MDHFHHARLIHHCHIILAVAGHLAGGMTLPCLQTPISRDGTAMVKLAKDSMTLFAIIFPLLVVVVIVD